LLKNKKYKIKCKGVEYRWWSRPDNGQSHAINQGFEIAKGDILAWINSDDYFEPGTFEFIKERFKQNFAIDLIFGDGYTVNEGNKKKELIQATLTDYASQLKRGCTIFQPSAFFTKKIIRRVGLLDESLHYTMDYDLWLRILKRGKAMHFPKVLSNFRKWEDSKTVSQSGNFLLERKKIYKKYGGNLIDQEIISRIKNKVRFINYLKRRFPKFHQKCKNIFYFFIDKLRYKNNIKYDS
jgi:glycosyltransferase involved in cell wall biosynthesis